jgi:hypothetical protein
MQNWRNDLKRLIFNLSYDMVKNGYWQRFVTDNNGIILLRFAMFNDDTMVAKITSSDAPKSKRVKILYSDSLADLCIDVCTEVKAAINYLDDILTFSKDTQ